MTSPAVPNLFTERRRAQNDIAPLWFHPRIGTFATKFSGEKRVDRVVTNRGTLTEMQARTGQAHTHTNVKLPTSINEVIARASEPPILRSFLKFERDKRELPLETVSQENARLTT